MHLYVSAQTVGAGALAARLPLLLNLMFEMNAEADRSIPQRSLWVGFGRLPGWQKTCR